MTGWPDTLTVAPIREWPGALTSMRRLSGFSAALNDTLAVLDREIRQLCDTAAQRLSAELLVAIDPSQFRQDGRPYANAKAQHPGVIFSIDSKFGHLSYPCDTFTRWEDNLRGIALALEALRKVDRYGVTKRGEQYRGFLAIEAPVAAATFITATGAAVWLNDTFGEPGTVTTHRELIRRAQRATHPDLGGDPALFQRVAAAEAKLREEGML